MRPRGKKAGPGRRAHRDGPRGGRLDRSDPELFERWIRASGEVTFDEYVEQLEAPPAPLSNAPGAVIVVRGPLDVLYAPALLRDVRDGLAPPVFVTDPPEYDDVFGLLP